MIRPPLASSYAAKILATIAQHGPVTFDEGVAIHGLFNNSMYQTRGVYFKAARMGYLLKESGTYHRGPLLCDPVAAPLVATPVVIAAEIVSAPVTTPKYEGQITPPRAIPTFKPMAAAGYPGAAAYDERLERRSFLSSGSEVRVWGGL